MKKNRYIVLAVLSVCALYLFEAYVLTPATEDYRESLLKQYKTLQRYERVVQGAGTTEEEVGGLITAIKNLDKRLINEKSDFLASARMQREISDLTGRAGLTVSTVRPFNAVKQNNYSVIPVYFEGNGNIRQISEFLKLVESDLLLLKIDKLSLNITNMQKTDDLKFKIQISGLNRA